MYSDSRISLWVFTLVSMTFSHYDQLCFSSCFEYFQNTFSSVKVNISLTRGWQYWRGEMTRRRDDHSSHPAKIFLHKNASSIISAKRFGNQHLQRCWCSLFVGYCLWSYALPIWVGLHKTTCWTFSAGAFQWEPNFSWDTLNSFRLSGWQHDEDEELQLQFEHFFFMHLMRFVLLQW